MIWMNESAVDFAVSLSKVDNHCGIVRGMERAKALDLTRPIT